MADKSVSVSQELPCGPIVELLGDSMAQVLWEKVKQLLILPYLDLQSKEFDLSVENRQSTDNRVVRDAVEAIKLCNVCVKCATKIPEDEIGEGFSRSGDPSVNRIIRSGLGGIVVRETIMFHRCIPLVKAWNKPITTIMLNEEDSSICSEIFLDSKGVLELVFTPTDNSKDVIKKTVANIEGGTVALAVATTEKEIENFATFSFEMALYRKCDIVFSNTINILPTFDGRFSKIFNAIYERKYKCKMEVEEMSYKNMGVNSMARNLLISDGGFIWCMKYVDGDLMSSFLYNGFGMMSSVFMSGDNKCFVAENYFGPPSLFFHNNQNLTVPGCHPSNTIIAWALALQQRAKLDANEKLLAFAEALQKANLEAIRHGYITTELQKFLEEKHEVLNSFDYIERVNEILDAAWKG